MKKLILILLISFNTLALVGDEKCHEFAVVEQQQFCFGNAICAPAHENKMPGEVEVCIKWGNSPSQARAELVANKIKEKIGPELFKLNKKTYESVMTDVSTALQKLDKGSQNFVGALNEIMEAKPKTESAE